VDEIVFSKHKQAMATSSSIMAVFSWLDPAPHRGGAEVHGGASRSFFPSDNFLLPREQLATTLLPIG
jgi:hypothetical protein